MERGRGNRGRGGYGYGRRGGYRGEARGGGGYDYRNPQQQYQYDQNQQREGNRRRGGYGYTNNHYNRQYRGVTFEEDEEESGWSGDQRNMGGFGVRQSSGDTGMGTTRVGGGRRGAGRGWNSRGGRGPVVRTTEESGGSGRSSSTDQFSIERSISHHPDPVPAPVPDCVPNVQQNEAPNQLPSVSSPVSVVRRPDHGGVSKVRTCMLQVNHFPVSFNPDTIIKHYDIDVKPEVTPRNGRLRMKKTDLLVIKDKLFGGSSSEFASVIDKTGYDGEKNIFSAVTLPTGTFKVNLEDGDDSKHRTYEIAIKLVAELKLRKLKDYISGNASIIPRDILQGMDVVMKENPSKRMICVGRSFHSFERHQDDRLGFGLTASKGFQQSLRPTSQGLTLCLDYSVLALRKRLPVIDFLKEQIPGFDISQFGKYREAVANVLSGIKVSVTHRLTKQRYAVKGLTEKNTRYLTFFVQDPNDNARKQEIYVVEYFRQKHQKEIVHKDIPSLDVGTKERANYVPMEFCVLVEGQIYPTENLDRNASFLLKKISLAEPWIRKKTICDMIQDIDGPSGGNIIRNFDIQVDTNMTLVEGRVIGPPELKLSHPNGQPMKVKVEKEKCQWNLLNKGVVEGKAIENWAILDFSASERYKLIPDQFSTNFIGRCKKLGMHVSRSFHYEAADMRMFSNMDRLRKVLEKVKNIGGPLQIIVCVMSRKDPGYKHLKWISETMVGVITQCCLVNNANKSNDQYLANLALKINAKLGGSNAELCDPLPHFDIGLDHVMFVGADVNHPGSNNKTSPSISAVVATMNWPAANRYAARVRPQDHRQEKIQNFGELCLELVESHARQNKGRPSSIVIFRDGVSESQFYMVLQEELADLKRRFQSIGYSPRITVIVAQKRHHTRLFPASQRDGGSTGNIFPGTVVDTKIVHPFEFDFYLCSHYGSLGTSKPTHYHVLWDEHNFGSDKLQKLIYDMCFTFARCTKPVSLVPPVYYADLVAYRGRLYYEAGIDGSPTWGQSSSSSMASSSFSSVASLDDKVYKLRANIEDAMYFV